MKKIVLSILFLMIGNGVFALDEQNSNEEISEEKQEETQKIDYQCYEYFYEIPAQNIEKNENNELKIISQNKSDMILTQSGEILPYLTIAEKLEKVEYKNEYGLQEFSSNDFDKNTYKEMDTLENRYLIFELEKKLIENNFLFNLDFEARNYDLLIYISENGEDFDLVEKQDINNHSFKYIKLETTCKNYGCAREKIKINELNFRENQKTIITKFLNQKDLQIFAGSNCDTQNIIENNPDDITFVNNSEVPSIEINLEKRSNYNNENTSSGELNSVNLQNENLQTGTGSNSNSGNIEQNTELEEEKQTQNNNESNEDELQTSTGSNNNSGNIQNEEIIIENNLKNIDNTQEILRNNIENGDDEIIEENEGLRIVVILCIIFMFIYFGYYLVKNN